LNELKIFNNEQFGQVRTIEENNNILFCGSDVARALGYKDTVNALKQHCKENGVAFHHIIDSLGRKQEAKFINEGNLYRLIANSKLPSAEKFESWIFDEVLPTIRKHGAYVTNNVMEQILGNPDFGIKLLSELKTEREKRVQAEQQLEVDKPKVIFADAVSVSHTTILVGELAWII